MLRTQVEATCATRVGLPWFGPQPPFERETFGPARVAHLCKRWGPQAQENSESALISKLGPW